MKYRLSVVPTAERHLREASKWWGENRQAAPTLLADEVERAFVLLADQPGIGARVPIQGHDLIRRFHLGRIGYHIYYRVVSDHVEILAFWHSSRGSLPDF